MDSGPAAVSCVCVCILSLRAPCGDLLVGASPQAFLREISLLEGLGVDPFCTWTWYLSSPVPPLLPPLCAWVLLGEADAFGSGLLRGEMHLSVLRSWQLLSAFWPAWVQ